MRRPLRALGPLLLALLVAVTVQSLVPSSVNAQQQEEDVVYLKDGSVLRGTVIEDVIGEMTYPIRSRLVFCEHSWSLGRCIFLVLASKSDHQ